MFATKPALLRRVEVQQYGFGWSTANTQTAILIVAHHVLQQHRRGRPGAPSRRSFILTQTTYLEQRSLHPYDVATVLLFLLGAEGPASHDDLNAFLFFLGFLVRHPALLVPPQGWP